ncbi:MAG: glycosyltransferase [Planctomycetota bacterium]|nr:glycosyltransferase [Planctomycetota bacterium]
MRGEPVKVMRIIARLNVGGPALHCLILAQKLNTFGFRTTLVAGQMADGEESYEKLFSDRPDIATVPVTRLQRLTRLPSMFGDLLTLFELIRMMRKLRPAVVHTHTAKAGVLGRIAAFVTGVPVVVHTFHGHVLHGYFSPLISKGIALLERGLGVLTSAIVTLSPALRDELSGVFKVGPKRRFRIIPLGRDLDRFYDCERLRGSLRKELGLDSETPLLGCIGRLVPIKDHETLLRAFAELPMKTAHLILAGDGELNDSLQEMSRVLGLEARVHFLGWRSDLPAIYSDIDALVLSSKNEGTPLSIIESFASSCPVVSTAVGGVPDMFHNPTLEQDGTTSCDEGILVPKSEPSLLSRALERMLGDASARTMRGERALAAAANYSDHRLAERIAGLYKELLARH